MHFAFFLIAELGPSALVFGIGTASDYYLNMPCSLPNQSFELSCYRTTFESQNYFKKKKKYPHSTETYKEVSMIFLNGRES